MVGFSDDILMQEIIAMARDHGFHVRISCGLVCVDRVPNIVARHLPENVQVMERKKKAGRP